MRWLKALLVGAAAQVAVAAIKAGLREKPCEFCEGRGWVNSIAHDQYDNPTRLLCECKIRTWK